MLAAPGTENADLFGQIKQIAFSLAKIDNFVIDHPGFAVGKPPLQFGRDPRSRVGEGQGSLRGQASRFQKSLY